MEVHDYGYARLREKDNRLGAALDDATLFFAKHLPTEKISAKARAVIASAVLIPAAAGLMLMPIDFRIGLSQQPQQQIEQKEMGNTQRQQYSNLSAKIYSDLWSYRQNAEDITYLKAAEKEQTAPRHVQSEIISLEMQNSILQKSLVNNIQSALDIESTAIEHNVRIPAQKPLLHWSIGVAEQEGIFNKENIQYANAEPTRPKNKAR